MTDGMRELIQYHHLNKTYSFHQHLQLVAGGVKIRLTFFFVLVLVLLPMADAGREDGMRVVPAQEILDKIERGEPVEYDHVIVKGDLDIGKLDLPKGRVERTPDEILWGLSENVAVVSSPIRVNDSTIEGFVYFDTIIFDAIDFSGTFFNGSASFIGSSFKGIAGFWGSSFNGAAYFIDSSFNDNVGFGGSSFNGTADFIGSSFNGTAYFNDLSFNGIANFRGSSFNGSASFIDSSFTGIAGFSGSSFNGEAFFSDSSFNAGALFSDSSFNGTAGFWNSSFNDIAYFHNSSFNGFALFWNSFFNRSDFSSSQFNKQVSFDDCRFNGSSNFNASRFKEDALFEGADFNGTLYLTRAKYDKLYISWKNIKELGYDDAAYLALLENFKKLGYFEDYDACYYDYRRLHREQDWSGRYHAMHPAEEWTRKRIDALLEMFYGYGKKPLWPLLWSAGTIILFGIIWLVAGMNSIRGKNGRGIFERFGQQNATVKSERQGLLGGLRVLAEALLFSAIVFLSGTRLFVEPPAQPEMQRLSANQVKWAMIFERVLGALFSILFFLAISGTVIR